MESIKSFFIKRTTIIAIAATVASGLIIHMYKIVNPLPNWDGMYLIKSSLRGMSHTGRWLSGPIANTMSSPYSLPWVLGVLALVFLALAMALLVDLFEIKKTSYIILSAFVLTAFPSVAATFTYIEWADAYFLSFLFAILAVYLCVKGKKMFLLSALFISLSLGIYQTYFSVTLICFLLYIFKKYILDGERFANQLSVVYKFVAAVLIGVVLYFVLNKVNLAYWNLELSNYQGVDSVGLLSPAEYLEAFKKTFKSIALLFMGSKELSYYLVLNGLFLIILLALGGIVLSKNRFNIYRLAFTIIFLLGFFVSSHIFFFFSPGVQYHTLMMINLYFIYFLAIVILTRKYIRIPKLLANSMAVILMLLVYYNFVNANVAYTQMHLSYEKSSFAAAEIMNRMDSKNDGTIKEIYVVGKLQKESDGVEAIPEIMGASSDAYLSFEDHFQRYFNYYLGRKYEIAEGDKKDEIRKQKAFQEMNVYPYGNYTKVIDGTMVVRLSK